MKCQRFKTEAEMASVIVNWLKAEHWEVFQEVRLSYGEHRADIVARMGKIIHVIETKLTAGMDVLDQALFWRRYAHLVTIAYPRPKTQKMPIFFRICEDYGFGRIQVDGDLDHPHISYSRGTVLRKIEPRLSESLVEDQKICAVAGTKGGYWTPFYNTCREVSRFVKVHNGCSFKELMDGIETHYSSKESGKQSIAFWIKKGKIPNIQIEYIGRLVKLIYKD